MARRKHHWLFKTEPGAYSIQDLAREKGQTTYWDGVRNYQARNLLRDDIKKGDAVFFYHSNAKPPAIVGTAVVTREGYPDSSAWTNPPGTKGHDPKSDPESPTWYMVDIQLEQIFDESIPLETLREQEELAGMMVIQKGSRLSVQPVSPAEWKAVLKLARKPR